MNQTVTNKIQTEHENFLRIIKSSIRSENHSFLQSLHEKISPMIKSENQNLLLTLTEQNKQIFGLWQRESQIQLLGSQSQFDTMNSELKELKGTVVAMERILRTSLRTPSQGQKVRKNDHQGRGNMSRVPTELYKMALDVPSLKPVDHSGRFSSPSSTSPSSNAFLLVLN